MFSCFYVLLDKEDILFYHKEEPYQYFLKCMVLTNLQLAQYIYSNSRASALITANLTDIN